MIGKWNHLISFVDCNAVKCNDDSNCVMGVYKKEQNDDFCENEQCGFDVIWVSQEPNKKHNKGKI